MLKKSISLQTHIFWVFSLAVLLHLAQRVGNENFDNVESAYFDGEMQRSVVARLIWRVQIRLQQKLTHLDNVRVVFAAVQEFNELRLLDRLQDELGHLRVLLHGRDVQRVVARAFFEYRRRVAGAD